MDFEFDIKTLEEIASPEQRSIAMGPFGSNIRKENYKRDGVPIIRGLNLNAERFHDDDFVFLSEAKADELKSSNAFPEDIIFTAQGNVGQVGIIPKNAKYQRYVLSQNLMKITCDKKKVNPLFIFYFFRSNIGQHEILSRANTTGVPCISQPLTSLKSFTVPIPDLKIQNFAAKLLSDLDDKIQLNRKMNQTLEQIAQAIFKHWFIDFEFPNEEGKPYKSSGGEIIDSELEEIPKGWTLKPLDEIAEYLNGLALQKFPAEGKKYLPVIKIRELKQGITDDSDKASPNINPEYVVNDGDIIFSWSGSLDVKIWCGGKGALNQHLFKVNSKKYPKWFYYLWTKYHLPKFIRIASDKATTMGHIQRQHLSESIVFVPPINLLNKFDKTFNPIIEKYILNELEARNLKTLRDTLLPKLISGKIRVKTDE